MAWSALPEAVRDVLVDHTYWTGKVTKNMATHAADGTLKSYLISQYVSDPRLKAEINHLPSPPAGVPQLLSGQFGTGAGASTPLLAAPLAVTITQAIANWAAAGASPPQLHMLQDATYQVGTLPPVELGSTTGNVATISPDAAGNGWFIDPTPTDNSEFSQIITPTTFDATPGSPAFGQVDLLTVVEHEMGHILGLPDLDPAAQRNDLMDTTLAPGVRREPSAADVAAANRFTSLLGSPIQHTDDSPDVTSPVPGANSAHFRVGNGLGSGFNQASNPAASSADTSGQSQPSVAQAVTPSSGSSPIAAMKAASGIATVAASELFYIGLGLDFASRA